MKDDLARVALGLMTASLALTQFRSKHRDFLRSHPPLLVHPGGDCIAWGFTDLRAVADYFGNEGWCKASWNRRTKEVDDIEIAVVGFPLVKCESSVSLLATTSLDVRGGETCNAHVETLIGPVRTL